MNLNENDITILIEALEFKLYDTKEEISKLKKRENPGIMLDHYQGEAEEIKSLIIKLENENK
jgi:hypothetical protein